MYGETDPILARLIRAHMEIDTEFGPITNAYDAYGRMHIAFTEAKEVLDQIETLIQKIRMVVANKCSAEQTLDELRDIVATCCLGMDALAHLCAVDTKFQTFLQNEHKSLLSGE